MHQFRQMFDCMTEVIADYKDVHAEGGFSATREDVRNLLSRRPCTLEDIAAGLSIHRNEAVKHLQHLMDEKAVVFKQEQGKEYYQGV